MKKVLLLNYEFPPLGGGASPVSYEIAHRMSLTEEFDIDVVTMGYKELPQVVDINNNLKVYRVKCWRSKKELCHPWEQLTYLFFGYLKCRKLIKEKKYDLCHVHFLVPTGILAWVLKKQFKLKYVVTVHGSDVPGFNPDRFRFLHRLTGPALRVVGRGAAKIISPSDFLKKLIVQNIDASLESQIVVIPNGINVDYFYPISKKKYIVTTGRLLERKGFHIIIRSLHGLDCDYNLYICGDGPMLGRLKNLASELNVRVKFCGWLNNTSEEYRSIINEAAVYISASSIENASIALLEAMSAGCAVISSDIEANRNILGNGGVFFKVDDYLDLNKTVRQLISNEDFMSEYQERCRKRAEQFYDWNVIVGRYVDYINKFIVEDSE